MGYNNVASSIGFGASKSRSLQITSELINAMKTIDGTFNPNLRGDEQNVSISGVYNGFDIVISMNRK